MVKQSPRWIHEVVKDLHKYSGQNSIILPSIQVKKAYLKEILTPAIFNESLQQALKAPSGGVIFWNWKALEQNREKLKTAVIGQ
ncbi:MAG: hypothetical protein GY757_13650, partial [bacterium]|nr:hypothetical protein [bacterium]